MNRGTYRLVFNAARGVWMAVAECARGHGKDATGRARRRATASIAAAASLAALLIAPAAEARRPLANPLPVPAATFVTRGMAADPVTAGSRMTIHQDSAKAVLNWNSFDIESGYRVTFSHPTAAAATLNKIGGNDPSVIRGMVESVARDTGGTGGAVYLVNRNGILFAEGAQVNVGGLTASALDIADDIFMNGLLSGKQGTENTIAAPVFAWGGNAEQYQTSDVRVEAGAEINTSQEGRVMLLAPTVENRGRIATPQGQTILAGGAKVYLAAPVSGSKLRGFLVEVDPGATQGATQDVATNLGQIIAERGNITIAALAVNQQGLLKATTSVDLNGSIYLQARDSVIPGVKETASDGTEVYNPLASRMGTLTFGAGSLTEVAPDTASTRTLRDDQTFNRSELRGAGKTIVVEDNAAIVARAGEVSLTAQDDITNAVDPFGGSSDGSARVYLAAGSRIDVSGLRDVALPVERNVIEVELRGNELKDSPLQRKGVLAGQKVLIDIRTGTTLADVSGYIAGVQRGIAEKSTAGGSIVLKSEGDAVVRAGASLDVSGGSIAYSGGDTGTTRLVADGRSFGIATASAERTYTSFVKDTYRYEAGYLEGKNAGTVAIYGDKVALDGSLKGGTVAGIYQRDAARRPLGGKLTIGRWGGAAADGSSAVLLAGMASAVRFGNGGSALPANFGIGDALPDTLNLNLDSNIFTTGGFTRLQLNSAGRVELPADVRLVAGPGGSFAITGSRIDVQGTLATPGGEIALTAQPSAVSDDPSDFALTVGGKAILSTAGTWVSDLASLRTGDGSDPLALKGGTISLKSDADLNLAAGSLLDVSGGGWLQATGKYSFGDAGRITLATGTLTSGARPEARMVLGGTLAGYGLSNGIAAGKGGSLDITASNVSLGGAASGRTGELHLAESFFTQGGFRSFSIASRDNLSVAAKATIRPAPLSRVVGLARSGSSLAWTWTPTLLSELIRSAGSLKLAAPSIDFGDIAVGSGAHLAVDDGGSIALTAGKSIHVDGTLEAAGGSIALTQTEPTQEDQYLAERAIWLGANARLLAQGYARLTPNAQGLRQGTVYDGGSIAINAAKGYLVTEHGALLDASGTAATLDFVDTAGGGAVRTATLIGSDGGTISLAAREGMLLDGDLKAQGGSGALGGALSVAFDASNNWTSNDPVLRDQINGPRRLVLTQSHDAGTAGMNFGPAIDTATRNGLATIAASTIEAGGFADVALTAKNRIEFDGNVSLMAQRSIRLDAPNLKATDGTAATLNAGLVSLGNRNAARQGNAYRDDARNGTGTLTVNARHIDLEGTLTLQNIGTTTLNSQGDIGARAVLDDVAKNYRGAFISGGNINLNADRIYPSTLSDFSVEIHNNSAGKISIGHLPGQDGSGGLLSAGGRLVLAAPNIDQAGTLKAPFGAIELRSESVSRVNDIENRTSRPAGGSVLLTDDSVTSVSGEGQTIPLGKTDLSGQDWVYLFGGASRTLSSAPGKRILLDADRIAKSPGAVIDLSGGGEMQAWEFVPGTGGSKDVLDPAVGATTYAIVPTLQGVYAPYDRQAWSGTTGLAGGDAITLGTAVGGLAAGTYALLPARYALLPGAYTVTFTGSPDAQAGRVQAQPDGGWLVAAKRATATLGGLVTSPRSELVEIASGDVARTKSEYIETSASSYFSSGSSRLPGDAGQLSVRAGSSLTLAGTLNTTHAAAHRGAEVDIAANKLAVRGTQAAQGDYSGFVTLDVASLNRLGAESIVLGGIRSRDESGTNLAVAASNVVLDNAGSILSSPDLILAATDTVILAENAAITASGGADAGTLRTTGDGALLRVSGNGLGGLIRTGTARTRGTLEVKSGATLTGAAVTLDATGESSFGGVFGKAADGGNLVKALALGAKRINLGEVPLGTAGLTLNQSRLAELGAIDTLRLKSYTSIDLYGEVGTGDRLKTLELQAGGIAGLANAGKTATLAATNLALSNPDGIDFEAVKPGGLGSGTLALTATDTLTLGRGDFKVDGFASSTLSARQIVASGMGNRSYAGDLTMKAGRITASSDARQKIAAAGKLVTQAVAQATPFAGADFGGQLTLSGATLRHGGNIELPAGKVVLQARAGDLELLDGSNIAATGAAKTFADKTLFVSGGTVVLESAGGDVVQAAGAGVDVSGARAGEAGGDAGRLEVRAADGTATLAGTLKGQKGASDAAGGEFLFDAGSVADLSTLAGQLGTSGFDESIDVRARGGDMTLSNGTTLKAHEVKLATDDGNLTVAGTIDASGAKGGSIELWANRGATANTGWLRLAETAQLKAKATEVLAKASGTRGEGGDVTLGVSASSAANAAEARLLMLPGSAIDVAAAPGSAAAGGKVLLRAPRVGTNEIAITGNADGSMTHRPGSTSAAVGTTITGASSIVAEAVRIYETAGNLNIDTARQNTWKTETDGYMANAADIKTRLGWSDALVRPGIEARATGDITLADDWNLFGWRHGGQPGLLTLRAEGDVKVNANLSDGFSSLTAWTVGSGESWGYRIVAGSDNAAADPLALTVPADLAGKGNLTLAAGKMIRTGTGAIDIAAGGDITAEANAVVYTAGKAGATIPAAEFAAIHASNNASFPTGGGDLVLVAQGDIRFQRKSDHTVVDWLWRQGRRMADGTLGNTPNGDANNTAWWINFQQFKDGVGALGGGDVTVTAGDDITGLSVSAPTNARLKGKNILPNAENLVSQGGGDVSVAAGGSISNGEFYAAAGDMDISAGDAFGTDAASNDIALGDSAVRVQSGSGARVARIIDPFLLAQAPGNVSSSPVLAQNTKRITYFSNYGPASGVSLATLAGDLTLGTGTGTGAGTVAPSTLTLAALGGSIGLTREMTLAPSSTGNLGLFAGDSIAIGGAVRLSDAPLAALAGPLSPQQVLADAMIALVRRSSPPLHAGDTEPVRIVALHGDIIGYQYANSLYLPKRATIQAGGDIVDLGVVGQNLAVSDVTRIIAGGDIVFNAKRLADGSLATNTLGIGLGGPGRLEVIAGGDVDLGSSKGIVTRGNFDNPFLTDVGASILVQAGATAADYAGFLAWLEDPAQAGARVLAGYTSLGSDAARTAFLAQADSGQKLNDAFYAILRGVGRAAATSGSQEYATGYDAIAALFPKKNGPYDGDIKMFFSQIKTEQGGGIDLLAPGGMANAGLAVSSGLDKRASELGITTARGGSVRAMVRDDFAVNQSRVFTLQGGDILIWSSEGDIDAGKGAKTAASTPPPQIIVRGDQIILDTSNSVSGSGIGVLLGKDGIEPGSVDLIAPKGAVIAGEAGIRALGDIYLAAAKVVGADNIQAGGKQIGVPQVEAVASPPPPPPAAEAAKAADAVTASMADSARSGNVSNSILTVEVLALGDTSDADDENRKRERGQR